MVEVGSDIKGLKDLAKNADNLKKSFAGTTLRTALRNGAKPVRDKAKASVPVDEGKLKRSIGIRAKVSRGGDGYADVGFSEFYGGFIELGTSRQQAQPFLRPALEGSEGEITAAFVAAMNATIAKALGRL